MSNIKFRLVLNSIGVAGIAGIWQHDAILACLVFATCGFILSSIDYYKSHAN